MNDKLLKRLHKLGVPKCKEVNSDGKFHSYTGHNHEIYGCYFFRSEPALGFIATEKCPQGEMFYKRIR